ncbi:hypothetical protein G6F37_011807 [Rhizopus arrhizus]|nr:hypothetical protein G6F38_011855 [Rhizopus arrhizus]KAG1147308.1 hypothetical protein G6F37_011807 [Rhizopus arrhizus]
MKLSNLPFILDDQLSSGIFDLLAPYGIFQDHGWFDGTSYTIIQQSLDIDPPDLTRALLWDPQTKDYATWPSIPLHCSYCHEPDYSKVDCRKKTAVQYWIRYAHGYERQHCTRNLIMLVMPWMN